MLLVAPASPSPDLFPFSLYSPRPSHALQKRQLLHEQAVAERDKILDVFWCVERMRGLREGDLRQVTGRETLSVVDALTAAHAHGVGGRRTPRS